MNKPKTDMSIELDNIVKSLTGMVKKLESSADKYARKITLHLGLPRSFLPALPVDDLQSDLDWLDLNKPQMANVIRNRYTELISLGEEYEKVFDTPQPYSFDAVEQHFKYCIGAMFQLASTIKAVVKQIVAEGGQTTSGKPENTQNGNILTGEPLALGMLLKHPDWPDTKIATAIGVSRTTLYDWPNFKKAKEALKQGKNNLPKGSKNGETGDMEAWDEKD